MPRRGSTLTKFIWDALPNKKNASSHRRNLYSNLNWVDKRNNIWCLVCMHMNNKRWKREHGRIFEDWHKLRPRKDDDIAKMRQRFLVALKKCKNFKRLEERCTSTDNYYQFLNYGEIDGTFSFDPGPPLSPSQDNVQDLDMCVSSNCDDGSNLDLSAPSLSNTRFSTEFLKLDQFEAYNTYSHGAEAMNSDQSQLSPGVESGYGSGMEENMTMDSEIFNWFKNNFSDDQLDNMLNCSADEPSIVSNGGIVEEQSLNGNQIDEIASTVEINVPVADFVELLKRTMNQSQSRECITLSVPSDVLNHLQDASKQY